MRKSKFSDEQKVLAVKEIAAGAVEEVARRLGVSAHTLYRWRAMFSGIDVHAESSGFNLRRSTSAAGGASRSSSSRS